MSDYSELENLITQVDEKRAALEALEGMPEYAAYLDQLDTLEQAQAAINKAIADHEKANRDMTARRRLLTKEIVIAQWAIRRLALEIHASSGETQLLSRIHIKGHGKEKDVTLSLKGLAVSDG